MHRLYVRYIWGNKYSCLIVQSIEMYKNRSFICIVFLWIPLNLLIAVHCLLLCNFSHSMSFVVYGWWDSLGFCGSLQDVENCVDSLNYLVVYLNFLTFSFSESCRFFVEILSLAHYFLFSFSFVHFFWHYSCLQGQLWGSWVGKWKWLAESMRITINTVIFICLCHLALDHWRGKTLFFMWFSLILDDTW